MRSRKTRSPAATALTYRDIAEPVSGRRRSTERFNPPIDGSLNSIAHLELSQHLVDVLVYGVRRDEEPIGNLAVGEA